MKGVNPFDKYKPEVPTGVFLKPGEPLLDEFEELGLKELPYTGFVLIAGGLEKDWDIQASRSVSQSAPLRRTIATLNITPSMPSLASKEP